MSDSDTEMSVVSTPSDASDFHAAMLEFVSDHATKFTDGEYKTIVDTIVKARSIQTNFFRLTLVIPSFDGDRTGCLTWERAVVTVALNKEDEKIIEFARLIHPYMAFGKGRYVFHEGPTGEFHTCLLPVIKMEKIDPTKAHHYDALERALI